ncbi:metalloregulator ArsR/SmtB family transcription factor [Mesorhizobium sp. SP-1A]|jgi:DNA-binding transcriptional ArsR family regulator|uniref:ArsR/SmtB family transcription factor n=1 Tax=Mesorhizobium sp. SP-1A TaxID=3077840 RepID=UPI0028F71182|nr:metalloregulator ArsR/SmtB family transcription factor [Mesorhizobium sp. SP-1A]
MNEIAGTVEPCPSAHTRAMAAKLAALSHPARLEILRHLAQSSSCCCGEVVRRIDLAQSTVSQHLKVLVEAGLVRFAAEGQRSRYTVDRAALAALSRDLAELVESCRPGC